MKKLQSAALALVISLVALVGFTGAPASAHPAGQQAKATPAAHQTRIDPAGQKATVLQTGEYISYCTGPDGRTFEWNTDYYRCNGWIDKYISGEHVAHLNYSRHYAAWQSGHPAVNVTVDCAVGTGGFILTLAFTDWNPAGWVTTAIGVGMLLFTCRNG